VGVPDAALLPLWRREFPRLASDLHGADGVAIARLDAVIDAAVADVPSGVPGIGRIRGWEASLRQALVALAVLRASFEEDPADVFVEKLRTLSLVEATEAARYLGAYRVANLDRFFRELISELEKSGDQETLLRRLRTGVADGRDAEGSRLGGVEDAVRVMTIHKAKGLAFTHTYVVQLHKQSGRRGRTPLEAEVEAIDGRFEYRLFGAPTLGFHAVEQQRSRVEAAERVRSLYVAMTRARDRIVLLGVWPREAKEVAPAAARSHVDLLASRRPGIPDLADQMARLAREGRSEAVDHAGVRWVFPSLWQKAPADFTAMTERAGLPSTTALCAAVEDLRERRTAADERSGRPWNTAPSADSHAGEREEQASRRFGDLPQTPGALPGGSSRAVAKAAGTAVHRILEDFDLGADPAKELERQRERLPDLVAALAGEGDLAAARARAEAALATLGRGGLLAKLCGLAEHVVSRELPVLLPPPVDGPGAVGFIAGSIDLVYRDPEAGEWVVADYKTDRIEDEADVADRVARYTEQGRSYQRALREALGLAANPRFELWFLHADRVEVVA
jgi:ATP-dependent helicase/nuclease subunit A